MPPMSPFASSQCSATSSSAWSLASTESETSLADGTRRMRSYRLSEGGSPLQLSPLRERQLLNEINTTVNEVLSSTLGDHPMRANWQPKGVKKDVSYYVDNFARFDQTRFCCVSETSARVEDIMQLFAMADDKTMLKNDRVLHSNVLEARVLGALEKPTPEQPHKSVYLRYSSYAAHKPMVDRDLCTVVATNMFTHADGSTVGYCLWDSVEIPEYQKTQGLVRSRMFRSGFVCRTTNGNGHGKTTKIAYIVGTDSGGASAQRLASWVLMEQSGRMLSRLCNHFRRKHLNPATFRPRADWSSPRTASQCRGCVKPLQRSFTTRHNCVACGEVFCRACSTKDKVDLPGVGVTSVRFCVHCLGARGLPLKSHETSAFSRAALAVIHMSLVGIQRMPLPRRVDAPQLPTSETDCPSSMLSSFATVSSSASLQDSVSNLSEFSLSYYVEHRRM